MMIIDGDGHVMEPDDLWSERMDADRWGDWIPQIRADDGGAEGLFVGGVCRSRGSEMVEMMKGRTGLSSDELFEHLANLRKPGASDPHARIADMDAIGIDAAVLYPSSAMFYGPSDPIEALHDAEFVAACQGAYNDWISEYASAYPDRLFAVGCVPLQDIDLAVAEVDRVVARGMKGVFIRPSAYIDELPLSHEVYDPFWAACQAADLPVGFHPAVHIDTPGACSKFGLVRDHPNLHMTNTAVDQQYGGSGLGQAIANPVDMIVTMGRMLMGGVCERFPELRLLFLESGGGWVPTQLERMDEQVEAFPLESAWLTMKPSEYFERQCYVSFEPGEWNLAACVEHLGADRVIWASDYPHPEYHDEVVADLREALAPLAPSDQAIVLGQSSIDAYRLPL